MIEIVAYSVFVALIIVGLCDILHIIWMKLLSPSQKPKKILITYLNGQSDYLSLNQLYEKYKWYGKDLADKIVVITDNNTDPRLQSEFSAKGIFFLNKDVFSQNLLHLGEPNEE